MTVGEFYEELRALVKRGTSINTELPGACRRAVRWIEQNYTLQYMRQTFQLELVAGAQAAFLPDYPYKAILSMGWREGDLYFPLSRRDFDDQPIGQTLQTPAIPRYYSLNGTHTVRFDFPTAAAVTIDGLWARYSSWPSGENGTHWLLSNAEGLLRAQTMLELMAYNRDDRSYQMFLSHREEQMKVLQNADYEARFGNQDIVLGQG